MREAGEGTARMGRWGRGGVAAVVVLGFLAAGLGVGAAVRNLQAGKTVVVPAAWEQAWQDAHVREGQDVVLAWGDRAGADPTRAPAEVRFDAARAVAQLDALYALDVHDLDVVAEDGAIARHKIVVVVDGTWSSGPGAPASAVVVPQSGGLARDRARGHRLRHRRGRAAARGRPVADRPRPRVRDRAGDGGARPSSAAPSSTRPGSWPAASPRSCRASPSSTTPAGFASDDAATFWAASAAYLATVAAPGGIGNPADLVRSPQLHWASPRLGDGSWLLLQYLAERDGEQLLGSMWREAEAGEDPLTTYKRLTGLSQADLNRRVAEYALRTVTWDFMDRSAIAAGVDRLDPVLLADRTTPVEAVEGDPGHYRVLDAFAPSDYGFTIVRLEPDPGVRDIHVRVRGHDDAADAGLSFGFVAMRGGCPAVQPRDREPRRAGPAHAAHGRARGVPGGRRHPDGQPPARRRRRVRRGRPLPVRVPGVGRDRRRRPRRPRRRWAVTGTPTAAASWTTPRRSTRPPTWAPTPWSGGTRGSSAVRASRAGRGSRRGRSSRAGRSCGTSPSSGRARA